MSVRLILLLLRLALLVHLVQLCLLYFAVFLLVFKPFVYYRW
jgi:hypothetical protein